MKKLISSAILFVVGVCANFTAAWAQCAMCRATVENNLSSGESNIGAGLNTGIIYLMLMPYLILAVVAYAWYAKSRKEKEQKDRVWKMLRTSGLK
jgi:hypothetical protein